MAAHPAIDLANVRNETTVGQLPAISCHAFPRCSYWAFVPETAREHNVDRAPLVISVHGSDRGMTWARERFVSFAEAHDAFVLVPCFPMDLAVPEADEEYKYLTGTRERSDLVLIEMIRELEVVNGVSFDPVLLFGYSGGGQLAHRFMYVHPERVAAVSIGAPGMITLLSDEHDWWVGVRDAERVFGSPVDRQAIARVPAQILVGELDTQEIDYYGREEMGLSSDEYEAYGATRVDRAGRLRAELEGIGSSVRFDLVPELGHRSSPELMVRVHAFFAEVLGS